jgi:hypothetical protein
MRRIIALIDIENRIGTIAVLSRRADRRLLLSLGRRRSRLLRLRLMKPALTATLMASASNGSGPTSNETQHLRPRNAVHPAARLLRETTYAFLLSHHFEGEYIAVLLAIPSLMLYGVLLNLPWLRSCACSTSSALSTARTCHSSVLGEFRWCE